MLALTSFLVSYLRIHIRHLSFFFFWISYLSPSTSLYCLPAQGLLILAVYYVCWEETLCDKSVRCSTRSNLPGGRLESIRFVGIKL